MFFMGHMVGYYINQQTIYYYNEKYNKHVTVPVGYPSDGATGALDVCPEAYFVHDLLCDRGTWDDGTPCTNIQASEVISDILSYNSRWIRSFTWKWATFLFGGGRARKNGMFKLREEF